MRRAEPGTSHTQRLSLLRMFMCWSKNVLLCRAFWAKDMTKIGWQFVDRINGGIKYRMEDMTCEEEVFLMEERWSGVVNNVRVAPMCDLEKG